MRAYILATALTAVVLAAGCGDSAARAGICGDGVVDSNEQCDDGSANGTIGDPCDASCQRTAACGNGKVDVGEECDDGNAVNGDGCDSCKFSCVSTDKARDCAPADACAGPSTCNDTTHVCSARTKLPDKTPCTGIANGVCSNGVCTKNGCGNGVRDQGEQCDDGNNTNLDGCDSACQFEEVQRITSLVQNTGVDANFCAKNALGSALTETGAQIVQMTWDTPVSDGTLSLIFKFLGLNDLTGGDTPFTLGFVRGTAAGRKFSNDLPVCGDGVCTYSSVPSQSEWHGPADPDNQTQCPVDCAYNGNADLDWWYILDPTSADASGVPNEKLTGEIKGGRLSAGPGTIALDILFGFRPTRVKLFDVKVQAAVDGAATKPTAAAAGGFSGHLASEHLDPALTAVTGSSTGQMCSQVSAASLAATKLPSPLSLCSTSLPPDQVLAFTLNEEDPDVTHSNSLLDGFVFGCKFASDQLIDLIVPTQPDGSRDGKTYRFKLGSRGGTNGAPVINNAVVGCSADNVDVSLDTCLANATFSSFFTFSTDRVILRRQ